MKHHDFSRRLLVLSVLSTIFDSLNAVEVCSNTILPGSKGDLGEGGGEGDQGRLGKTGPPGLLGASFICLLLVFRLQFITSHMSYSVILGIKETEEKFYLIVKEARKYREALINCKLRGGMLAMPKTTDTNTLIADYVTQAGLTQVFIGLQAGQKGGGPVYADLTPVRNYTAWGLEEPSGAPSNTSCVKMVSTGTWKQVECDITMYYVCEFKKSRRGLAAVL
uniref:collectin-10 n=1 Tax=Oncorhynchus gorbuscha TaxID=8017 RepID=UPI001EAF2B3C|nr:collectin-10 [Oncorhynchus gorbuscha]